MNLKKCGKITLKLLVMCLVVFLLDGFLCESVYAEEPMQENESIENTEEFNASLYLMAVLDNSYKNDSTILEITGLATAEEAAENYKQGIDTELAGMESMLSAEEMEEYRKLFEDLLAGVKYTVGEAEKQADGSYVVTVYYEQMNVFGPAMQAYFNVVYDYVDILAAGRVPSEEELTEWLAMALKYCVEYSLKNVTYDEPQTTTVRISAEDIGWTPDSYDMAKLENLLFDIDDAVTALY